MCLQTLAHFVQHNTKIFSNAHVSRSLNTNKKYVKVPRMYEVSLFPKPYFPKV